LPCHVSSSFGPEGKVFGLGLNLECQVLGFGTGLAGQVIVNITAKITKLNRNTCNDIKLVIGEREGFL